MKERIRYANSSGAHIAYRVFAAQDDRSPDIVLIPGTISHVELFWELPNRQHLLKRLTTFARVIVFDKRGQGLSDRIGDYTLEERIGDVRAVMDAAGSETATIYGWSEGAQMCLTFAATYPQRTSALVLFGGYASVSGEPWSATPDQFEAFCNALETHWGEGVLLPLNAPSRQDDRAFIEWFARLERASASPGSVLSLMRANYQIDVRPMLPTIHVPTLIMHRREDALVPVAAGRYLAEHIPGARYVELPGSDHMIVDEETEDLIADEIEEFMTGTHRRLEPDRVLATVMFTDIVGSTQRAVELGDKRWRDVLASFYSVVGKELGVFGGRQVNTAGDGVLATFDGPARGIRCAFALRDKLKMLGLQARTGLHTGECELMGNDIGGIAVHIGARVASTARPDEVLVSNTVKDLVAGSKIEFIDRGMHALKGVPGEWRLFSAM